MGTVAIAIPGTEDHIVLLDHVDGVYPDGNLMRVTPDGEELWRVRPGDAHDKWVSVDLRDGELHAHSWKSWTVRFDLEGRELGREWTK